MDYVLGYCVWVGLGVIVYCVGVRVMCVLYIYVCVGVCLCCVFCGVVL